VILEMVDISKYRYVVLILILSYCIVKLNIEILDIYRDIDLVVSVWRDYLSVAAKL